MYSQLAVAGGEFDPAEPILLGRDGRLYPLRTAARRRFLLDDHPRLVASVEAAELPYAFADARDTNAVRFFISVGVQSVSGVAGGPRWMVGADRPAPPRLNTARIFAWLHSGAFASALATFVGHRVIRTGRGREIPAQTLGRRLRGLEHLRFFHTLSAAYRIGGRTVEVPARVHVQNGEVVLSGVRAERDVLALLAHVIAEELTGNDPAEWVDPILRLLQYEDAAEVQEYLADRGVPWAPPAALGREGLPVRDALSEALAEQLGFDVPSEADPAEDPEPLPARPTSTAPPPAPPPLPPINEVQLVWEDPEGAVIEDRPGGRKGGGGGGRVPPRNDAQDRQIGQRGEELVYLRELARVRAAGFSEDQVVWVARDDPMADHDIRSVGEDGRTIWIEVKATTGKDGRFRWSRSEIVLATRKRDRYFLCRVYAADSTRPIVKSFPNPAALLLDGRLKLDVAVLQAEVEGAKES